MSRPVLPGAAIVAALVTAMAPLVAEAADAVQFASDVFVERFEPLGGGRTGRVLERPAGLHSGDRLVFVVSWRASRNRDFTVTNPLPRAVAYQRSAYADEEVSIDGGRTWGQLDTLRIGDGAGRLRHAVPEDVTHVRWRVPARLAMLGSGQITYRGVVR